MQESKPYYLTKPQAEILMIDPKELYAHIGRRGGKSTEILAHLSLNRIYDMPRAGFLMLGSTYQQVLTRTLPGTLHGWEKRGFIEGVHYVLRRKPPEDWPKTYFAPKNYDHFLATHTGAGFHLGSQDSEGLVNSLTVWGLMADESKLLNEHRFKEDAVPTNSGPLSYFPEHPHNRFFYLTSSMPPVPSGNWLYDMEKRMDKKQIETILKLALKLEEYKAEFNQADDWHKPGILKKINALKKLLFMARKNSVLYYEASTFANVHILGLDYYKNQMEVLGEEFYPEICNIRPKSVDNMFYANLKEKHFYTDFNYAYYNSLSNAQIKDKNFKANCIGDNDRVPNLPLRIGMDFGARINCIVTAQRFDSINTFKFLKNHFVKRPKILNDVVKDWCDYYAPHPCKDLYFYYDNTGNNSQANSTLTLAEQAKAIFEANGWNVFLKTKGGANVSHELKYYLWNLSLIAAEAKFPFVLINKGNCEELKYSMEYAPTIEDSKGKIKKDKSSERRKSIPDEYSTDLSDAADVVFWGEYSELLNQYGFDWMSGVMVK